MSTCRIVTDLKTIQAEQWQELEYDNNPFLSYPFLSGLEEYKCLYSQYWQPRHLVIEDGSTLLGILPLYLKHDSYGEFVFDWSWADAYQQAGRNYYPKLVSAIPFTPVSGHRLLINRNHDARLIKNELTLAAISLMEDNKLSSLHFLFPNEQDVEILKENQGLKRTTCQYHWFNKSYRDFQDFTDSLTSKKRKAILAERRKVENAGIEIERLNGNDVLPAQWEIFYEFYCSTFQKKWGEPRLTLDFFMSIGEKLSDQVLLILAKEHSEYIAGAFAMSDNTTLYGRHWGCKRYVPFLHFELCYYQTIEYTIQSGLKKLDAGVQGEHKLARGFHPVAMSSLHWIRDADFRVAIEDYLNRETRLMGEHLENLKLHLPFKTSYDNQQLRTKQQ